MNWRYATKKFDNTKLLDGNQVNIIKEAFNLTATSYGLQPVKLVIFSDKELLRIEDVYFRKNDNQTKYPQRTNLKNGIAFVLKSFAKLYGVDWCLDTDGEGFEEFLLAIEMRNRITHPKHENDSAFSDDEIIISQLSHLWIIDQMNQMFRKVDTALGLRDGN